MNIQELIQAVKSETDVAISSVNKGSTELFEHFIILYKLPSGDIGVDAMIVAEGMPSTSVECSALAYNIGKMMKKELAEKKRATLEAVLFCSEVWHVHSDDPAKDLMIQPKDHPDRQEGYMIVGLTPDGLTSMSLIRLSRNASNQHFVLEGEPTITPNDDKSLTVQPLHGRVKATLEGFIGGFLGLAVGREA